MSDREMLAMVAEHFEFLRRLAATGGPLRANGKIVPKWRAVAYECQVARERVLLHLAGET